MYDPNRSPSTSNWPVNVNVSVPLFVTIVLDGVGIGAQPDSNRYGDAESHTLAHICDAVPVNLPHLERLGLGCVDTLKGVPCTSHPLADYGKMREISAGKDSTSGHWELAGLFLNKPLPTYPPGFPPALIESFLDGTGCAGILGNVSASGTEIIFRLGEQHQQTGFPIVYTSSDSVFQIAAHVGTIALEELYRICQITRDEVCVGEHAVGRVIARPFTGKPGTYTRISADRKDYSLRPPTRTIQEALQEHGILTVSIGKIRDLFGGVGFDRAYKTKSNGEGIEETIRQIRVLAAEGKPAFVWTNLVDFDQEYGHRNDPEGFASALEAFDRALPEILNALPEGGRIVITADHGNDPVTPSTDHSREYVPLLVYGGTGRNLGTRSSFMDHAASVAAYFGVPFQPDGAQSFLSA